MSWRPLQFLDFFSASTLLSSTESSFYFAANLRFRTSRLPRSHFQVKALVIDFGGTHATCGLVEDRVLLAHETFDTDCAKSLQAVLLRIREAYHELMQGRGLSSCDVAGVAIGFAALVDSRVNRILSTNGKYDDVK